MREAAEGMSQMMLDPRQIEEILAALPDDASGALATIAQQGGTLSWPAWERKFGSVRAMGPARRDRERPWRAPSTVSEALWYRGLLGRAFRDSPKGPEEFAYIPNEVLPHVQCDPSTQLEPILETSAPPAYHIDAAATILDDCTTLLAALRRQSNPTLHPAGDVRSLIRSHLIHRDSLDLALAIVRELGLLAEGTQTIPVRDFLIADRMLGLRQLYSSWRGRLDWNDLAALPHLRSAGDEWPNDPALAKETIMRWMNKLSVGAWYSITSLIRAIYEEDPTFQRPGGNFDSWFLLDRDGIRLDGIEHWYAIEGALLRSMLSGPLRWFGMVQLGLDQADGPVTHFSPTRLSHLLENPDANLPAVQEKEKAVIRADGLVSVPRLAQRAMRYQLARFLDWDGLHGPHYHYRLSIRAIIEARQQGLNLDQVRTILAQAGERDLPPSLGQALEKYAAQGYQAEIVEHHLLRVSDPALLSELLSHPSCRRFIHERLNDTTALVRQEHWGQLIQGAVRLGILIDSPPES